MISSQKLRMAGITAALLTIAAGLTASRSIGQGANYHVVASIATAAFAAWVLCAAVLLVRLCKGLYATRTQRSGMKSALWVVVIVWAPIVVPLIARSPLSDEVGRAGV